MQVFNFCYHYECININEEALLRYNLGEGEQKFSESVGPKNGLLQYIYQIKLQSLFYILSYSGVKVSITVSLEFNRDMVNILWQIEDTMSSIA